MAVYTKISKRDITIINKNFDIEKILSFHGIKEGIENMKTVLVVGAGFSGVALARELVENDPDIFVEIIEERPHIGGNAYDYENEKSIRVHKYGPHLFHTNNKRIWDWVNRFGEWIEYKHKVKAILEDGTYVTLPVNKETKEIVGEENIIKTFFAPYTYKMWGKKIEELDPSILRRVPIRDDDNEEYFPNDSFQVMPKHGYTKVFEMILDVDKINVKLSQPFDKTMEKEIAGYSIPATLLAMLIAVG